MRLILFVIAVVGAISSFNNEAKAADACKVCSDQQRACMKNYAGPTCKFEYQMCMKSCGKKS